MWDYIKQIFFPIGKNVSVSKNSSVPLELHFGTAFRRPSSVFTTFIRKVHLEESTDVIFMPFSKLFSDVCLEAASEWAALAVLSKNCTFLHAYWDTVKYYLYKWCLNFAISLLLIFQETGITFCQVSKWHTWPLYYKISWNYKYFCHAFVYSLS